MLSAPTPPGKTRPPDHQRPDDVVGALQLAMRHLARRAERGHEITSVDSRAWARLLMRAILMIGELERELARGRAA